MGEIMQFRDGCRGCLFLRRLDKNLSICAAREYTDGSQIYPIVNGIPNPRDWNACNGESFERQRKRGSGNGKRKLI